MKKKTTAKKLDGRSREARAMKANKLETQRAMTDAAASAPEPAGLITSQTGKCYAPLGADKEQIGGDHYMNMGVQPWTAMESWMTREQFAGFLRGNAIKYLARCGTKGGVEDLRKARHYLDKLLETSEAV